MAQALRGQVSLSRRKGHRRAAATAPSRADLKSGLPRAPPSPWRAPGRPWGQEVGLDGGGGAAAPPGWASISLLPPPHPEEGRGSRAHPGRNFPRPASPGARPPGGFTRFYSGLSQGHSSNTARRSERARERERERERGSRACCGRRRARTCGQAGGRASRASGGGPGAGRLPRPAGGGIRGGRAAAPVRHAGGGDGGLRPGGGGGGDRRLIHSRSAFGAPCGAAEVSARAGAADEARAAGGPGEWGAVGWGGEGRTSGGGDPRCAGRPPFCARECRARLPRGRGRSARAAPSAAASRRPHREPGAARVRVRAPGSAARGAPPRPRRSRPGAVRSGTRLEPPAFGSLRFPCGSPVLGPPLLRISAERPVRPARDGRMDGALIGPRVLGGSGVWIAVCCDARAWGRRTGRTLLPPGNVLRGLSYPK